jgi:hypothetical protein
LKVGNRAESHSGDPEINLEQAGQQKPYLEKKSREKTRLCHVSPIKEYECLPKDSVDSEELQVESEVIGFVSLLLQYGKCGD